MQHVTSQDLLNAEAIADDITDALASLRATAAQSERRNTTPESARLADLRCATRLDDVAANIRNLARKIDLLIAVAREHNAR